MKKITILGFETILGHGVAKSLEETKPENYELTLGATSLKKASTSPPSERFKSIDYNPLIPGSLRRLCDLNSTENPDYIINCLESKDFTGDSLHLPIAINATFPHMLTDWAKRCGVKVIHTSSAKVFKPKQGVSEGYLEGDREFSHDYYGQTKRVGEPKHAMVLRTPTPIGPCPRGKHGVIKKITSYGEDPKNESIECFSNQFWNGITSKEFGNVCISIIENGSFKESLIHISGRVIPQVHLYKLILNKYNLNLKILPAITENPINEILSSNNNFCSNLNLPPIEQQIKNL